MASHIYLLLLAAVQNGLNCQQLSSHLRPSHAVDNSNAVPPFILVLLAKVFFHFLFGDCGLHSFSGYFPADLRDLPLELSHSELSRVLYHLLNALFFKVDNAVNSVLFYLKRNQVVLSDLKLLLSAVARNFNQPEPVEKRSG